MKFPIHAYIELAKPRILTLILVTTALGFFLGGNGIHSWWRLMVTLVGAGLTCGGASALNHYLERDADSRMKRTRNRPIPAGVISPSNALSYGVILVLLGVMLLACEINILTAFLSLLTAFLYVLVYTPMKKLSWLNTSIGAIPGALPPMGGWAAATGQLDAGAWVLFLILFMWQHPHFYAIAWMFKDDYKLGGFKMLPVIEPDGQRTFSQIRIFSLLLIPISLLPTALGLTGPVYFWGALISGVMLLCTGLAFTSTKSHSDAHKLLRATIFYLPVLLFLIVIDFSFLK